MIVGKALLILIMYIYLKYIKIKKPTQHKCESKVQNIFSVKIYIYNVGTLMVILLGHGNIIQNR